MLERVNITQEETIADRPNRAIGGESWWDVFGCIDADGDGVSNYTDFDDTDANETYDSDGDGIGDNSDKFQYVWGSLVNGRYSNQYLYCTVQQFLMCFLGLVVYL